jgi:hypothetical protein
MKLLASFGPLPLWEHRALIFLGSFIVGLTGVVLAVLAGLLQQGQLAPESYSILILTTALMLATGAFSIAGNYTLPRLRAKHTGAASPASIPVPEINARTVSVEASKDESDSSPNCVLEGASASTASGAKLATSDKGEHDESSQPWKVRMRASRKPILIGVGIWALLLGCYAALLEIGLIDPLVNANRFPTFWRAVHLYSGVSPLLPQVLFLTGFYAWFLATLHGLALLGEDRPLLPSKEDLVDHPDPAKKTLRILSRETCQLPVELEARPLGQPWLSNLVRAFPLCFAAFWLGIRDWALRSLGERTFGHIIFCWLVLMAAVIVTDVMQLLFTWRKLRELLVLLDRMRVRRTLAAMKGISWGSVWKMGGNVLEERYRVLSRQFESLSHLHNTFKKWHCSNDEVEAKKAVLKQIGICQDAGGTFARWYVDIRSPLPDEPPQSQSDISAIAGFQQQVASTAGTLFSLILVPQWQKESESLLFDASKVQAHGVAEADGRPFTPSGEITDQVRAAEEFFVLPYLGFIQNTVGRIRTFVYGILAMFVAMTLAISSYPFDPLPVLAGVSLTLFLLVGIIVASVYAGMARDATLSYITNTKPGELGLHFWTQMITFGAGPLVALLTTLFPSIADFLMGWLQPGAAQALK